MFDTEISHIHQVMVHRTGNKTNGENLHISPQPADLGDENLRPLLMKFFFSPFNVPEFQSFTFSNGDHEMNPMFRFAADIFDRPASFPEASADIARYLYDLSVHPQIKAGDLFVAYFSSINLGDEVTDAIAIFKSEYKQPFLQVNQGAQGAIQHLEGINISKADKGCIIFNSDRESGFQVCVVDRTNRTGEEAQYWKEQFLQVTPRNDDFHQTREVLNLTKEFVTTRITDEYEMSQADKINVLNRSVEYFKTREAFDKSEFEREVLEDQNLIQSFRSYDEDMRQERGLDLAEQFTISPEAVKKGAKNMKSVLKLDKNFHVYIHGDREMIERGVDPDGRKYYKIYFEQEK